MKWIATDSRGRANPEGPFIGEEGTSPVCCLTGYHSVEQTTANARLIAAAPALLKVVQAFVEWNDREVAGELDEDWDWEAMVLNPARAALAGATHE